MTVRLEGVSSAPLPVNAGAPQGSVLGCYLFNVAVDSLEDDFLDNGGEDSVRDVHLETLVRTDDYPAASTPVRVSHRQNPTESPIAAPNTAEFAILPRVANVPPWLRRPKDPTFTSGSISTYKYVDDEVNTSKVNMKKAKMLVENGEFFKEVRDLRTQGLLEHIAHQAELQGMSINAAKTGLMLVSAATSFTPRVQVQLQGETICGTDKMKILGVTVDSDASFRSHVTDVLRRLRSRSWALSRLKKKGLSEEKLVQTYKCLIRPAAEYACPAWHSSITASQAAEIEKQQTIALRNIFGPNLSAAKMRDRAKIDLSLIHI